MADVRSTELAGRETAHGDHAAAPRKLGHEPPPCHDLPPRGPPIRLRLPATMWMSRNEIPEENVVGHAELGQDAVHYRRARLSGSGTRELALGGEWNPADPRPSVTGGLSDDQEPGSAVRRQVVRQPFAPKLGANAVAVEVEGLPDSSRSKAWDEAGRAHADIAYRRDPAPTGRPRTRSGGVLPRFLAPPG